MNIEKILGGLKAEGNYRELPSKNRRYGNDIIDFSGNDYLGLASDLELRNSFLEHIKSTDLPFSSSASRLLAASQDAFFELEDFLSGLYRKDILLFNSGYHANTGVIGSVASKGNTLIIADKLVHASIIDGIILSRADFKRFRHNDMNQLEQLIKDNIDKYSELLVITESVFSMDGDKAPLYEYAALKSRFPDIILYLDEAHAFGVEGEYGLGVASETGTLSSWDIIVGTFGKAAASAGAFVAVSPLMKQFLVNKSRSLIFSTALAPIQAKWTTFVVSRMIHMDKERLHLKNLGNALQKTINTAIGIEVGTSGHIQPLIVGEAKQTVALSNMLMQEGIKVLPIRTPTVPRGTERLRFSLSAAHSFQQIEKLQEVLAPLWNRNI